MHDRFLSRDHDGVGIGIVLPPAQFVLDRGAPPQRPFGDVPGTLALRFRAKHWRDVRDAIWVLLGGAGLSLAFLLTVIPAILLVLAVGLVTVPRAERCEL
jgi:hypothetical protein